MTVDLNSNIKRHYITGILVIGLLAGMVTFAIYSKSGSELPNPYLNAINNQAQKDRNVINRYLAAKNLAGIPGHRKISYKVVWKASLDDGKPVSNIHYLGCTTDNGQDRVLVVLWSADRLVRHAIVCAKSKRDWGTVKRVEEAVSKLVGKSVPQNNEIEHLTGVDVTFHDTRELCDATHWQSTGQLRYGSLVSIPDQTAVFVKENPKTDGAKGSVWFYWFVDTKGHILERGMTGS